MIENLAEQLIFPNPLMKEVGRRTLLKERLNRFFQKNRDWCLEGERARWSDTIPDVWTTLLQKGGEGVLAIYENSEGSSLLAFWPFTDQGRKRRVALLTRDQEDPIQFYLTPAPRIKIKSDFEHSPDEMERILDSVSNLVHNFHEKKPDRWRVSLEKAGKFLLQEGYQ